MEKALDLWAASVLESGGTSPWRTTADLYATIDEIQHGDAPWKSYSICYDGPLPSGTPPKWMTRTYELCVRDSRQVLHQQFATPEFKDKMNLTPYRQFNRAGKRVFTNLMSGDWAWKQAVYGYRICLLIIMADSSLFYRTLLPMIQLRMAQLLYPLLLEATKLPCLLLRDTKSTTQSICRQEL